MATATAHRERALALQRQANEYRPGSTLRQAIHTEATLEALLALSASNEAPVTSLSGIRLPDAAPAVEADDEPTDESTAPPAAPKPATKRPAARKPAAKAEAAA